VALSDDQKALLRLLAQREQGYEDIGALMGLSVGEVRERVREALAALNEADGARQPAPTLRLAERTPPPPPAPMAAEPQPKRRPAPRPVAREVSRTASHRHRVTLPKDRRRRFELAGAALIVILLVLFATGLVDVGGGGSSSTAGSGGKATAGGGSVASSKLKPTQAVLEPVGSGNASGRAIFGRSKEAVVLLIVARGLEASPQGESYAISLVRSPSERVPIAATAVTGSGTISGQYQVAPEALGLLAGGFDQMEVSLVSNATLRTALARARKERKVPSYGGSAVLRGPITGPFVNAAVKSKR
jgi:hypothetical protein